MSPQEMQAQAEHALATAETLISTAERQRRPLTTDEQQTVDTNLRLAGDLKQKIAAAKPAPTISTAEARAKIRSLSPPTHTPRSNGVHGEPIRPSKFSREYFDTFYSWLSGNGALSASLQEGVNMAGGYSIPVMVDGHIVPLAPQDSAIRRLATVVPTRADIKSPQVTARGMVVAKSEGSGFTVAVPSLGQFTLSAFAAGVEVPSSLEFLQDMTLPLFQAFVLEDAVSAFLEYEEGLFFTGSGNGQPQGLIGNVGAGVVEEADTNGNLVTVNGILDLIGSLKASYHMNASFVMQRITSLVIRKAQVQQNLFEAVFTRVGTQDLIFGYPVEYSLAAPAATRGNTPVLFGDFRKGYLIGDRGGSGLVLKILDQAGASQGLLTLLIYRRTDGRVRRSEAIQPYYISAS